MSCFLFAFPSVCHSSRHLVLPEELRVLQGLPDVRQPAQVGPLQHEHKQRQASSKNSGRDFI